jgi:hypothetical protein
MARPYNESLQRYYTKSSEFIRAMDEADGGAESPSNTLQTAIFALETGLMAALNGKHPLDDLTFGSNSAFDALVMLHELQERLSHPH